MNQILIVDDEPVILLGIQYMLEKLCPECRVAALAVDGEDGLQKIRNYQPDIVITDITMPGMDGLNLIRQAREEGFKARFIILSGYSDFNYARQAVSLGVEDYITKPVEEQDLVDVIRKVCQSIDAARANEAAEAFRTEKYRQYVLRDVLAENRTDKAGRVQKLTSIGFPLSGASCLCFCFFARDEKPGKGFSPEELEKTIRTQAETCLSFCRECFVLQDIQDVDCVLLLMPEDISEKTVHNCLGMFRYACMEKMNMDMWIGCSRIHRHPADLSEAFEEARCALNYRILLRDPGIIQYERISQLESKNLPLPNEALSRLEEAVDSMDDDAFRQVLDQLFDEWQSRPDMTLEQVKLVCLNILLTGIRKIPFVQFQLNEYLGKNLFSLDTLSHFDSLDQLKNWILNVMKSMNELMLHAPSGESVDVIEESKKYIRAHFTEEISLKDIADRFFINASYFSTLFKKRTGQNYQAYVTKLRVDLAKKLLADSRMRIYEICETVGYADMKHFNRVFEREVGVRPADYRKSVLSGE